MYIKCQGVAHPNDEQDDEKRNAQFRNLLYGQARGRKHNRKNKSEYTQTNPRCNHKYCDTKHQKQDEFYSRIKTMNVRISRKVCVQ